MNCILLPDENFSHHYAQITAPEQIAHSHNVLKAQIGDSLKIGRLGGLLGTAVIDNITSNSIQLRKLNLAIAPPAKLNVTVILALPRPKVLRRLLIDMTALGVRDIVLVNSYRTQKSYWQSPMLNRLDEFVLAGLQQGVDTIAPTITLQKRFKPFVEDKLADLITDRAIVAHPYSQLSFASYLQQQACSSNLLTPTELLNTSNKTLPSVVFIGSEGGWLTYEVELLVGQGCQAVNIGTRILRTEAAVNVILGQWLLHS